MLTEMASRRKSLKPTNKIHHQLQIDDDVDEDVEEPTVQGVSATNVILPRGSSQVNVLPNLPHHGQRTPHTRSAIFNSSSLPGQYLTMSQTAEPHIALPSDIYQDFEALKSATNMDTTELMRKLLTDFHKITSSNQTPPERKLDDVINDLFASANALDLSKRKRASPSSCSYNPGSSPATLSHGYTDDQLAMGILDTVEVMEESSDLKPLDLTLQKNQSDSSSGFEIFRKGKPTPSICPSLFNPFTASKEDSNCPQTFKHAGSYVINLEPGNESPQLVNSSLAQVLRMDIPLHSFSSDNKCNTESQETLFLTEGTHTSLNFRKTVSEGSVQLCQGNFRSKLFQDDIESTALFKMGHNETVLCDSGLSCLPSYAEAVTSVINSQHNKRVIGGLVHESSVGVQEADKAEQEAHPNGASLVHISTEDSDIKMFPLNLNSQLLTTASSSEVHPKQQHNLLQQLLQHQLKSENKSLQRQLQNASTTQAQQHQNAITTFCGSPISHVQMMHVPGIKSDLSDVQGFTQAIKGNDIQYPNFLLESHSVGLPSISTALSNGTVTSNTHPNASMPMSTFFMTTSANGGVGHMVAIPVIHAVSDGITGLQPFAFAPHPMPLQNSVSSKMTPGSDDIMTTSNPALPGGVANSSTNYEKQQCKDFSKTGPFTPETILPSTAAVKSKPGRPRGRGGRGQSQKTQNKDMKLLTENTLFPGVYTSILKLPWSRRSRNKIKTKTISELKKQAQIVAHSRVNESETNYSGERENKDECTEQINNSVNHTEQIYPQNKIEVTENQHLDQDLLDHNQKHQIQHQKLKDLEQQQRLHLQYHLRLQEEQQKLTKQIEQSYLNLGSDCPAQVPFAASNEQVFSDKQDFKNLDTLQSSDLTVSVASIVASDSIAFTPPLLSHDPVMMVYSNADISTPKKTPRKRGRPPKVPNLSSKTFDGHLTFSSTSLPNTLVKYEPENFLHTNVSSSNCLTVSADTKPHNCLSTFPQHLLVMETDKSSSTTAANFDLDRDITLESKINFLTNKIGLELSQSVVAQSSSVPTMCTTQTVKCENESGSLDDTMYQEMKMAINKSLVDVKPRRKKVSRLLKSDDNFMYATFKIKPKGLTPRKSRKRRKDVQANTAVVAETIANLRQKALRESITPRSDADVSKPSSMVAWKFHEQYPCSNEEEDSKDRRVVCVKCGHFFAYESDDNLSRECESCLAERDEFTAGIDLNETALNKIDKLSVNDTEMKAECCMTCGDVFQKHFSDPGARCDVCQNNAPRVIQSSKLFSFHDTPTDSIQLSSKPSATSASFMAATELTLRDRKFSDKGLAKINNNHLFCSLCRMEFTKICDYLAHIRDTHDTKLEETTQLLSSAGDHSRKTKISKTKKSLAHKTLTCPVEECPHFFREQKDLDLHFMKKHSNLSVCFQGNPFTHPDEQDIPLQLDHSMSTSEASIEQAHGISSNGQETLTSHEKAGPAVNTCEKPLQCEFCAYRCRQKNALTWHMRKHPEAASQYRKYSNLNVD